MMYLPREIQRIVGNQKYIENSVGMSESRVLMFPEHVLKIQGHRAETDNEVEVAVYLKGKLPVPEIPVYQVERGIAYTLMTRVSGMMLCDEEIMKDRDKLLDLVAQGIKLLWSVDIRDCPCKVSPLEERLKEARYRVEHGLVDIDNVEPETFGPEGFGDPSELLLWLETHKPKEDLVLTHGDFCLPNIFTDGERITGYIDLGKMGPADRWQDLAIVLRSLEHNAAGYFNGGNAYFHFEPEMLLDRLGVEMDEEKNKYYRLLDELF